MGKTPYNDGKPLRAIVTTYIQEIVYNTQINGLEHGNNTIDWAIRG
jgi:hypothetical protein